MVYLSMQVGQRDNVGPGTPFQGTLRKRPDALKSQPWRSVAIGWLPIRL